MKNILCYIFYCLIQIGLPLIFSFNGLSVGTWQWWALDIGIFFAYILGMLRMVDFE